MVLKIHYGNVFNSLESVDDESVDLVYFHLPVGIAKEKNVLDDENLQKYLNWGGNLYQGQLSDYLLGIAPYFFLVEQKLKQSGMLYVHGSFKRIHYVKALLLEKAFGRDRFLNELIWIKDELVTRDGKWPSKHETILVYVKSVSDYKFFPENVDRIDYMAPSLVTKSKREKKKFPTDTWWFTQIDEKDFFRRLVVSSTEENDQVLGIFPPDPIVGVICSEENRNMIILEESKTRAIRLWETFQGETNVEWLGNKI